jgi:hypothetical protein
MNYRTLPLPNGVEVTVSYDPAVQVLTLSVANTRAGEPVTVFFTKAKTGESLTTVLSARGQYGDRWEGLRMYVEVYRG